jgi:hypothetical protein
MSDKKIQVIDVSSIKLTKGAKYIFLMDPQWVEDLKYVLNELDRLIGYDNFTLLVMGEKDFKVLEVLPNKGSK